MGLGGLIFQLSFRARPTPLLVRHHAVSAAAVLFGLLLGGAHALTRIGRCRGLSLLGFLSGPAAVWAVIYPPQQYSAAAVAVSALIPAAIFHVISRDAFCQGNGLGRCSAGCADDPGPRGRCSTWPRCRSLGSLQLPMAGEGGSCRILRPLVAGALASALLGPSVRKEGSADPCAPAADQLLNSFRHVAAADLRFPSPRGAHLQNWGG